jgi:hypothetical protein
MYKNGFLNSIFSQNGVVQTTEGYNYLIKDDDVYMYTGITSVSSDESNIGFVLTNMRTKETNFYGVPGAEEYSAMASAEGQVQQMKYVSSFPLLINLNNRPTYLLSLKDNAGLVKMYAFIDVQDYQKVVVTDASEGINKAALNYLQRYGDNSKESNIVTEKEITVKSITSSVKDGNTWYYITDTTGKKYKAKITLSDNLPFISNGDKLKVYYLEDKEIIEITVKTITSSVKDGNTWYYITDTTGKKYKAKITLSDNLQFISNGDKVKVYFLEDKEIIEITDIK